MPMSKVAAVGEVHGENFISGLKDGEIDGGVRLGAGMRLDVRVVGSEELFRALDCEGFHDIDVFAAPIPAFAGVALGVFICEQRALRFHHSG